MRPGTGGRAWQVASYAIGGSMLTLACVMPAQAQPSPDGRSFGDLAAGPYERLVIRGAMVLPGHGGPPSGVYDIVIEGNLIRDLIPFDPVAAKRRGAVQRPTGDRVIEAGGMYVMPGMIDLEEVARIVARSKRGVDPSIVTAPFAVQPSADATAGRTP